MSGGRREVMLKSSNWGRVGRMSGALQEHWHGAGWCMLLRGGACPAYWLLLSLDLLSPAVGIWSHVLGLGVASVRAAVLLCLQERFVVHITDVLAVSMMLGITAQVKEAGIAWDKGEKKSKDRPGLTVGVLVGDSRAQGALGLLAVPQG